MFSLSVKGGFSKRNCHKKCKLVLWALEINEATRSSFSLSNTDPLNNKAKKPKENSLLNLQQQYARGEHFAPHLSVHFSVS